MALRIRRGEQVEPEEIAASVRKMEEMERQGIKPTIHIEDEKPFIRESDATSSDTPAEPVNEWLPENLTNATKRKKGKRR